MNRYTLEIHGEVIALIRNRFVLYHQAFTINRYQQYVMIEKAVILNWKSAEIDAVLIKFLQELHKKIKSTLTIVDRGDEQTPWYRLTFERYDYSKFHGLIDKIRIKFKFDHVLRNEYIKSFTDERDCVKIDFRQIETPRKESNELVAEGLRILSSSFSYRNFHMDREQFELEYDDLKIKVDVYEAFGWIMVDFELNNIGPYLQYFNSSERYLFDMMWFLSLDYPHNVALIHNINNLTFQVRKFNSRKQFEEIRTFLTSHPFQLDTLSF